MFVGIAAYRDPELIMTLKALIRLAEHPDRLRIVILNMINTEDEGDL